MDDLSSVRLKLLRSACVPNCRFLCSMFIRYEDMKGSAKCQSRGGLGSLKIIGNIAIQQSTY